jgi:hypothetical protein
MLGYESMKNIARLALFFTVSLAGVFFLSALVRFLQLQIDVIRILPPRNSQIEGGLLTAAYWALPLSLYVSLLLSLSYTVRRRISAPVAMLVLFVLVSAASLGIFLGIEAFPRLSSSAVPARPLGNPGLILTRADNALVLIQPSEIWSPQVVSIPGQPLRYQELPRGSDDLPPVPFRTNNSRVLQSLDIDLSLVNWQLIGRFDAGILSFMVYLCALSFSLISLRFVLDLSRWPLANLFLGALMFRGILSLETFLVSPEPLEILNDFLGDLIPPLYMVPLVFVSLGFLLCLYTFLSYLARKKGPP